jgi:Asp-tRNA(Asn)/Glu-tRNA(Gln) amidotransferase A subunit family amidase
VAAAALPDATAIAAAVRAGDRSAVDVAREHLEWLAADPDLGACWLVTEERALREAAAVDRAVATGRDPGPLAGVPVGWKDLIDTAGIRTTYGSAIFTDHLPARDAEVVERHAAAGAVTVAKLSLHELAWGTTNENPHFGACRNPHDRTRMPGGSSGGSAAALAAGMVPLAPGTDTGGSIRCPASCCGVVGLKPTFGRASLAGIRPLAPTLDHVWPMAPTVRDCALSLTVMSGPSTRYPRTPAVPVERFTDAVGRGVDGRTVAVAEPFFFEHTSADIAAAARRGVEALADAGARIVEIDLEWPFPEYRDPGLYLAEMHATLADHWPARRDEMGADVVRDMLAAERVPAPYHGRVGQARLEYAERTLERVHRSRIDLIATPTQAFSPPLLGTVRMPLAGNPGFDVTSAMCALTAPFNVLGWPAISVPCGRDDAGLPAGLQLAALPWREAECLAGAAVVEASGIAG